MTSFYLIRHAHAGWESDENRPLSIKGKRDATLVEELLQQLPITRIYSSPCPRALQTVAPLASRLDMAVQILPDLRERTLSENVEEDFNNAVLATWRDPNFAHPGGESNAAAQKRGIAVILSLQDQFPGAHLVLSTHGNLMALMMQHFDPGIDFAFWKALSMPDIYEIRTDPTGGNLIQRLWR